jgi:hypothetical protein
MIINGGKISDAGPALPGFNMYPLGYIFSHDPG